MDLVDQLYEAAAAPDLWPAVLENIAAHVGAGGSNLIVVDHSEPVWIASPGIVELTERYFREGWDRRNGRMDRFLRGAHTGFVRDIDIFDRDEIEGIPIVRDFMRPAGLGWTCAQATLVPTGEVLVLSVEQRFQDGPVTEQSLARLEALRPHLARASLLTAKLRFERAKAAVEAFELASVPAAIVRSDGRAIAANDLFVALRPQIAIGARDRICVGLPGAAALLEAALRQKATDEKGQPLSIAIPAAGDAAPLVLHVLPARGVAQDIFGAATALLIVTRLDGRAAPDTGLLRALFDLTPMEAKVAQAVLVGRDSNEIADQFGISGETFKTHMKSVLQKTGFRRRGDLVRFLSPVPVFG